MILKIQLVILFIKVKKKEGETYVGIFSFLFLFIAVLFVITTMTRIVKKQRYQIGTLKSLGVKKNKIIMHYVSYGFFISLIASILGVVLGPLLIGNLFIGMEMNYFQIPNGRAAFATISYLIAVLGAVIIYNLGILSFTEKQYQFATLKALGFKNKKIRRIYVKQSN